MATQIGFDPATWNSSTQGVFTLGQIVEYQGRLFKYVQNSATAAVSDGAVMCRYSSPVIGAATPDTCVVIGANRTSALAGTPVAIHVVGVGVGTITASYYGFVLVSGVHTNVQSTSSTLHVLQKARTTGSDQCTDGGAAGDLTFGTCLVATSGSRAVVDVQCLGR